MLPARGHCATAARSISEYVVDPSLQPEDRLTYFGQNIQARVSEEESPL
jgi:hypothetical protein